MHSDSGPYLAIAALCENVIEDKQGVLSLIRVVDRIISTVAGPSSPEKMPPVPINLIAVVSFKSGSARGTHTVKLRPEAPSGIRLEEISFPVLFEGEDRGVNIIAHMGLLAQQEGLYWFDVLLDDVLVTRIPLRLVYQRLTIGPPSIPPA